MAGKPLLRSNFAWASKPVCSEVNFLTKSACAVWEMFLIKRPFFRCHSIRGRFQRYGKSYKKEEFCEEVCRA
jgi:hypothetical protein